MITAAEDGRAVGFAEGEAKGRSEGKAEGLAEGEGKAEGLAEGEAKGKAEERVLIAKAMIAKGMDVNTISEITGLSHEEVKSL